MQSGAGGAFLRGLQAAGFNTLNGAAGDVVVTPSLSWDSEPLEHEGPDIVDLDVPGTNIIVHLGGEERRAMAHDTPVAGRWWIETLPSKPFSVPATVGAAIRVAVTAKCGAMRRDLIRGTLTVPHEIHNMGAPGTLILTEPTNTFLFLHLAEVDGERRYIAAHASLGF